MPPRPPQIRIFVWLIAATIAIDLVALNVFWEQLTLGNSDDYVIFYFLGTTAVSLIFVYLIAVRRSVIGLWVFTGLILVGAAILIPGLIEIASRFPGLAAVRGVQALGQLAALLCLFAPASRAWMRA
ncbi:MAG: hypothetical protein ACFBSD_15055 [Paracoccaceae bacterium]